MSSAAVLMPATCNSTSLQLIEAAEHPLAGYAWPGNGARSGSNSPAHGARPGDVEMGAATAARSAADGAAAAAAGSKGKSSSNPFAGGLPAEDLRSGSGSAQPPLRRQPGSGGGAALERMSLGAGSHQSDAVGASPDRAAAAFGRRSILSDDDPLSPTWGVEVSH